MYIKISTKPYDEFQQSKPYIGRLTFDETGYHTCEWGSWLGQPGRAGELMLECEPNDLIIYGQKHWKRPRKTWVKYAQVNKDGSLTELEDRMEAFQLSIKEGGLATMARMA